LQELSKLDMDNCPPVASVSKSDTNGLITHLSIDVVGKILIKVILF